jgi:hypothetical protein
MLARLCVLLMVGSVGEGGIAAVSGHPVNQLAQFILWIGIAVVLALRTPISPPREHRHR